ncbi:MAG: RpiB/LacA/LacB family sugar-phosphate isomerase [Thermodesulfobacteriota bacterium]|jgi:ribose 5-phosphate isomerase RpiB
MRIATISEASAADKNSDIMTALDGLGHEVVNVGMKKSGEQTELSYIHTGLMAAILLNAGTVDFVVGGCGTGQGFLNSVMQYPGVSCGLIQSPLDGWLFMQINGGNCISLELNQGYGWAGDMNLKFIFEKLFSVEKGFGYPPQRREPQRQSRLLLEKLNNLTHKNMPEIIPLLPEDIIGAVVNYPGFLPLLESSAKAGQAILSALRKRAQRS